MRARPIKLRHKFWMVFRVQIYIRSELQIIQQVFIGLRDDFKKDWAVSEDNCFCRVFYPSGRLHWEKRDCFVSYQNPTPIFSANHLAWPISLWVISDPLHQAAFWRNENSTTSLGERVPKCPNDPRGQFNPIQPSMNKYITCWSKVMAIKMQVDILQLFSQWAISTGEKGPKNFWGFFFYFHLKLWKVLTQPQLPAKNFSKTSRSKKKKSLLHWK